MISTTPLRRMILHRSQRGLTDARTFMIVQTLVHSVALVAGPFVIRGGGLQKRLGRLRRPGSVTARGA
jgi:hypothetical protein